MNNLININTYRTQVYLGSDLWVQVSLELEHLVET